MGLVNKLVGLCLSPELMFLLGLFPIGYGGRNN